MSTSSRPPASSPSAPPPLPKPNFVCKKVLHGHKRAVSVVKFSPNGHYLASASADCKVKIWKALEGTLEATLEGVHDTGINDLVWTADSKNVITASDDKTLVCWDVARKTPVNTFKGHVHHVFSVNINPAGNKIVSGSFDEHIRIWDTKTGKCIKSVHAHTDPISSAAFNPTQEGSNIVTGSYDGLCRIWDADTLQCQKTIYDATLPTVPAVSFVNFSPNGKFIVTSTLDSKLKLWNYKAGKVVKSYHGHQNTKYCCFSSFCVNVQKGQFVVSGSEDNCVYLWDCNRRNIVQKLEGHTDVVLAVACHPTLSLIATGSMEKDKSIRIWEHKQAK